MRSAPTIPCGRSCSTRIPPKWRGSFPSTISYSSSVRSRRTTDRSAPFDRSRGHGARTCRAGKNRRHGQSAGRRSSISSAARQSTRSSGRWRSSSGRPGEAAVDLVHRGRRRNRPNARPDHRVDDTPTRSRPRERVHRRFRLTSSETVHRHRVGSSLIQRGHGGWGSCRGHSKGEQPVRQRVLSFPYPATPPNEAANLRPCPRIGTRHPPPGRPAPRAPAVCSLSFRSPRSARRRARAPRDPPCRRPGCGCRKGTMDDSMTCHLEWRCRRMPPNRPAQDTPSSSSARRSRRSPRHTRTIRTVPESRR